MEASLINELIEFRRFLHAHPELSDFEFNTQQSILQFLQRHNIQTANSVGKTGVLVTFDSGKAGEHLMIRGDIDALPIQEINDFDHQSIYPGISHKCGHDGHTSILCGLAISLHNSPIICGKVSLLFQPAEENGHGAVGVLLDSAFDINPDFVFALHNLPGYALHQIVCREASFTASVKSIIIKLQGKTSHAAEPELGINPAQVVSELIQLFHRLSKPDPSFPDFRLCTPVYIRLGEEAYGISAGDAEVHYTIRSWSNQEMQLLCKELVLEIENICKSASLKYEISWTQEFAANQNHREAVDVIQSSAAELGLLYHERPYPFKWGEDFGLFTERFKGAMFGIGAGKEHPALHNPDYDFPDELIKTGIDMFRRIIDTRLKL